MNENYLNWLLTNKMCDDLEFTQTQNVNDAMSLGQNESYDSTFEDENVWGKLFPNGKSFELFCMFINSHYYRGDLLNPDLFFN